MLMSVLLRSRGRPGTTRGHLLQIAFLFLGTSKEQQISRHVRFRWRGIFTTRDGLFNRPIQVARYAAPNAGDGSRPSARDTHKERPVGVLAVRAVQSRQHQQAG